MKEAMESNGGIPGVTVKSVKLSEVPAAKTVIKWDGISALNNFQFFPKFNLMVLQRRIGTGKLPHHGKTFQTVASFLIRSKFGSLLIHVLSQALEKLIQEKRSCKNLCPSNLVFQEREEVGGLFSLPEDGPVYSNKRGFEKGTLIQDSARKRILCKSNWRKKESSSCWFIYSIRTLRIRTTFPAWDGMGS